MYCVWPCGQSSNSQILLGPIAKPGYSRAGPWMTIGILSRSSISSRPSIAPMSSHGALPQELIDEVIDELGEVYRGPDREKPPANHINVARKTLHACALVSKCWTGRCRAHLFKEVKIRADGSGILPIPSDPLMPYITKLKIQLRCNGYRLFPSRHLLTPFYMAPITHLRITAGALATARGSLLECITALSATLQTVVFKSCSFPLNLVLDIVLTHPGLKQLHLHCCEIGFNSPDPPAIFYPGTHSTDTEIGLFSATDLPSHVSTIITTTQLPIQFSRFNFDYVQGLGMTPAAEVLIEASAKSLSSLTVHVVERTSMILSRDDVIVNHRTIQKRHSGARTTDRFST